jgi:hypothetical protein
MAVPPATGATTGTIARKALLFDRDELRIARGIRFAIGVGVPLFLSIATGNVSHGIAVSGGCSRAASSVTSAPPWVQLWRH